MEKAHAASAGPRSTMNPVVLEGPNPRPENEGGLLGRKISAQMRKANAATAMQAATIKTRRFGLLCLCCSGFPMISLVSMLPSIGEKPAVAVVGWVSGYAIAFGARVSVAKFGPFFDRGGVLLDARTARHPFGSEPYSDCGCFRIANR